MTASVETALLQKRDLFRTVDEALGAAERMKLPNVVILSEQDDGSLTLLATDNLTIANVNWIIDRLKFGMLS